MVMKPINDAKKIEELEKMVRVLQQKLKRSETNRSQLEDTNQKKEALLKKLIHDLKDSEQALAQKSDALASALKELQSMQSQLVKSEKMSALGVLVAGIAHEINNPINFIHGNVEYASNYVTDLLEFLALYQQEHPDYSPKVADKAAEIDIEFVTQDLPKLLLSIKTGCDRIRSIVLGLRIFSRLDQAEFRFANLHECLDSTLMILQHRMKAVGHHPGIQVIKEYGDLPEVECFPGQLNQVFMNILANAIDALHQGHSDTSADHPPTEPPTIRIQTALSPAEQVTIRITDNGPGISESTSTQLFEPFFTTKPVGKGTGLGLSISYQIIVEHHHGQLFCNSAPGQGATFVIEIPLRQPKPRTGQP